MLLSNAVSNPVSIPFKIACLHILCTGGAYYVPYSFLLISNKFYKGGGGSGPSRVIKFLHAAERPEQGVSSFMHLLPHPPPLV
jgi:hypothetical protein